MTEELAFTSADGLRLIASRHGSGPQPVLFLHGGGQTRHAWARSAGQLGPGFTAIALDQRGHGASDWSPVGAYSFAEYGADARAVAVQIRERLGRWPVAVGASLGGIAALLALREPADGTAEPVFSGLCLVDIVPDMRPEGVDAIQGFMRAHAREGFATVDEAAEAVAAYLPHRPRPASHEGLRRNLRLDPDGRWRWHWDPRFLDGPRTVNTDWEQLREAMLIAAEGLTIPGLLIRGAFSELVCDEAAERFLARARTMRSVSVAKARHMVAGDSNDAFLDAVRDFLAALPFQSTSIPSGG